MKKKLLLTGLVGLSLVVGANASDIKDATINVYGVGAKTDKTQDSSAGVGIMFDSDAVKVKVETTSDFIKTGLVLKFNPITENWYFKVGANYINQKMYAPDNTNTKVNQYSGALATGYMVMDDLYIELGGSATKLDGTVFGDYEIVDETTSLGYIEVAKRWESAIGTIDTTANAGRVNHEFRDNENSYGAGVDYYPMNNAKIAYSYQYEKDNIVNNYKAQYSFVFVEFNDNISNDTYNVRAGFAIAFDDIADVSTYKIPTNIKSNLSELHRFENAVFSDNMQIQSTAGVNKTQAAIDRDSTPPPVVDTEAPQLTSTSGSYDNNPDSDNTQTIDYSSVVSDNITLDANLKVNIVSSNPELTITNTGTSITFTRTDGGVGDSVVIFNFEDENGNVSVNYTQTLLGLDDS